MDIKDIKFSTNLYKDNLMATKKQKEFIEDNIDDSDYTEEESMEILSRLDSLTRKEASMVVQNIIFSIDRSYDEYDEWSWGHYHC